MVHQVLSTRGFMPTEPHSDSLIPSLLGIRQFENGLKGYMCWLGGEGFASPDSQNASMNRSHGRWRLCT